MSRFILENMDQDELVIYKSLIEKEYKIIIKNLEAFIKYDKITDFQKVAKLQEIFDFFMLQDREIDDLEKINSIIEIISIKNLKSKSIGFSTDI